MSEPRQRGELTPNVSNEVSGESRPCSRNRVPRRSVASANTARAAADHVKCFKVVRVSRGIFVLVHQGKQRKWELPDGSGRVDFAGLVDALAALGRHSDRVPGVVRARADRSSPLSENLPPQHRDRVVEPIDHTLLQRDDPVVADVARGIMKRGPRRCLQPRAAELIAGLDVPILCLGTCGTCRAGARVAPAPKRTSDMPLGILTARTETDDSPLLATRTCR